MLFTRLFTQLFYSFCFVFLTVPAGYEQIGVVGEDCPGYDITHYDVSLQECFVKCNENEECVGIVYSTDPTAADKCWLKDRLCNPTTPRVMTAVFQKDGNISLERSH